MKLRSPLVLLTLALAAPRLTSQAPEAPSVRLSLDEAVTRARAASARLGQLRAFQQAADAALRGARAGRLPQADLSASYTRNSNVPELVLQFPGAPPRTIFPNIPDNWRARAGVGLPLYTGGRVTASVDGASQQVAAAGLDLQAGAADLTLEATSAYWSLVTGRESERVLAEALGSYDGHLRDAQNRREQGLAARNEVLAVQVERDRAELWRLQARNAAELSAANLRRLLDLPGDTVVEASEPLSAPPAANPERAALEQAALEARPELKALQARVAAAEAGVRVQRAAAWPQLSLNAGYDYARPNSRILPLSDEWRHTWNLGLTVGVVAFDGGRISAATAQARAQADALRQQFLDAQRRVRLEVAQRVLEAGTARATLAVTERGLESARENVRVAGDRYHEGVSPSAELLDAETALLRASLSLTEAQASLRIALAGLERAVGR